MPPIKKITKEIIVEASFEMVKENGISCLNARSLAKKLKCSTQPIFSCFSSMKELIEVIKNKALKLYQDEIEIALQADKPFKASGLTYIFYAKKYPNLFKFIFMNDNNDKVDHVTIEDENKQKMIVKTIEDSLNISFNQAKKIYLMSWIFVHGIASMIAMHTVQYEDELIYDLIENYYRSLVILVKRENQYESN